MKILQMLIFINICFNVDAFQVKNKSCAVTKYQQKLRNELLSLSTKQKSNITKIINISKNKEYKKNLTHTALAISWQESAFGRSLIGKNRNKTFDCGVFQNNAYYALKRRKQKTSKDSQLNYCKKINNDIKFAYDEFLYSYNFWARLSSNRKKIFGHYNAGYKSNIKYGNTVYARFKVITNCTTI